MISFQLIKLYVPIKIFQFQFTILSRGFKVIPKNVKNEFSATNFNCLPSKSIKFNCLLPVSFAKCLVRSIPHGKVSFFVQQRSIHTSKRRDALPPLLLVLLRPIAKLAVIIFGRTIRVWWQKLPPEKKQLVLQKIQKYKFPILVTISFLTGSFIHYYLSHLEKDPITHRVRFMAFTREQIVEIGMATEQIQVEVFKNKLLKINHPQYARVVTVANRILQSNLDVPGIRDKDWAVTVVDDENEKNAFVLPNGSIFIFIGMINICDNDDQLGVILSHEMSHALLHHVAELMSSVQLIEWLLLIPMVFMWATLPDGAALFSQWLSERLANIFHHLPFSRAIETEADDIGLILAAKACFDIREASAFWAKMSINQETPETFEWLSTHPSHETREQTINALIPAALRLRANCNCPSLPLVDPRILMFAIRRNLEESRKRDRKTVGRK